MKTTNPEGEKLIAANSPIREREVDDFSEGVTHLIKTQDVEPIMDTIKAIPDLSRRKANTQVASRLLGTIPTIIAVNWAKESGTTIYSREFFAYARKQLLTNPDFKAFRVQRGKRDLIT